MALRIATFNVENLMERFDFSGWNAARDRLRVKREPSKANRKSMRIEELEALDQARMIVHEDDSRQMTALAIADCKADIICLQEVENLAALEAFEVDYLEDMTGLSYPHKVWIEGNDSRGIDVALMARTATADGETIEIKSVKSHHTKTFEQLDVFSKELAELGVNPKERVFRRDCLEVNIKVGGKPVSLFISHFKSMGTSREGVDGRAYTMPVRQAEARAVRSIINQKFGESRAANMRWLICGDMNDYCERLVIGGNQDEGYKFDLLQEADSGILALTKDGFSDDLVKRRVGDDRWTLHYANGAARNVRAPEERPVRHLVQLDYILASPAMAKANKDVVPDIIRKGQPYRTVFPPHQDVERYPRTGWDRPKASDHCPVAVTLKVV